jgi:hypothetical protein
MREPFDWREHLRQSRKELRAAMKWWRAAHPEYVGARLQDHGWYGRSVFALVAGERCHVASITDVLKAYRAREKGGA